MKMFNGFDFFSLDFGYMEISLPSFSLWRSQILALK